MPLLIDEVVAEVKQPTSTGENTRPPLPTEDRGVARGSLTEQLEWLRDRQQRLEVD